MDSAWMRTKGRRALPPSQLNCSLAGPQEWRDKVGVRAFSKTSGCQDCDEAIAAVASNMSDYNRQRTSLHLVPRQSQSMGT